MLSAVSPEFEFLGPQMYINYPYDVIFFGLAKVHCTVKGFFFSFHKFGKTAENITSKKLLKPNLISEISNAAVPLMPNLDCEIKDFFQHIFLIVE